MVAVPKPEFPRPEKQRDAWMNLNGIWDFRLFPAGIEEAEKEFSTKRVDYDRQIMVPFSWVCPLSNVQENVAGIGWYKRTVTYTNSGRLFLCFGAVDYIADVYVNGVQICHHQGGYTYFEQEVTSLWKNEKNVIEVRAEDYRRETQTYGKQGYGEIQGIWQTVWLEERPESYIENWKTTTKINGEVTFDITANAKDGDTVTASFEGVTASGTVQNGSAIIKLEVQEPKLWSPDSPYLYEGYLKLGDDKVSTYFGIREITTEKVGNREYKWILVNGKPIYLNGTLDQAFNPKGHFTYPSDQDMYEEAWRLKRLGLNMVRIHIKPEEPRKLYWMDKLGILVMEDIPCFWGAPVDEARAAYENELPDIIARDINHPATFAWVVFNESWGLLHGVKPDKVYRPETQEWVRNIYHKAKELDPSRIVEDNSPCRYDHVETDINTWHFYLNTYEVVRDHIRKVINETYPGSSFNFIGGNKQTDAPLMNSECGMVWGVEGSAGDSDIAWQYHYMLNEYRLHEKLCGFVFTEFHDVVNEFNGYYRIDNTDKDFGYQDFCKGMTIQDLHALDFIAVDCAPARKMEAGENAEVPLVLSSFTDERHGKKCTVAWELWHKDTDGKVIDQKGKIPVPAFTYGTTEVANLEVTMPTVNAVEVLSLYLLDEKGNVISRNFTTFDVHAELPIGIAEVPVCSGKASGFVPTWTALSDEKLCLGGSGEVVYDIVLPETDKILKDITIALEIGSKRILKKDCKEIGAPQEDHGFMRGYLVDRGAFANSYFMTDESKIPSIVEVQINGDTIDVLNLRNDYADARGVLSWLYQKEQRKLDEAGSFGEEHIIRVPSRLLPQIARQKAFELTLKVSGDGGLAIYGRKAGRYAHGIQVEVK